MSEPILVDLSGKTCLVTGANTGIGKAIAEGLARLKARVILACRNPKKGAAAREEIREATGNPEVDIMTVDLSSRRSIRAFAAAVVQLHPVLDVLVNSAGVWLERRQESEDGVELTWATNVLGYYLLTDLLIPSLTAAPAARIVNVASRLAGDLDLHDVEFRRRAYSGRTAYAQSKQADRMLTWGLARRLAGTKVTANAMHPGFVSTDLFSKAGGLMGVAATAYAKLRARKPEEGADTAIWLAAAPEMEGRTGLFWFDRQEHECRFRDPRSEDALLALCALMTAA